MAKQYDPPRRSLGSGTDIFIDPPRSGPPRADDRLINGVLWVLCSGEAWRDISERFGP